MLKSRVSNAVEMVGHPAILSVEMGHHLSVGMGHAMNWIGMEWDIHHPSVSMWDVPFHGKIGMIPSHII